MLCNWYILVQHRCVEGDRRLRARTHSVSTLTPNVPAVNVQATPKDETPSRAYLCARSAFNMIEYYVPQQTSKLVTLSRWAVGYGLPMLMLYYFLELPALHHWWAIVFPIPIALTCRWLATEGVNRSLLKTTWGQKYLHRQFMWVEAQRDALKAKGESGDNVYLDTGDFAASFVVAGAVFISALGIISFLLGDS